MTNDWIKEKLKLPVIQAPMFLISNPGLLIACAKSGIIGTLPSQNARSSEILDEWITQIKTELEPFPDAIWAINVITHSSFTRSAADIEVIVKHQVPLVISALGSPKPLIEGVHAYGGLVFADVVNLTYAKKSAAAGVDGLILIAAGAGGHTGALSPFALVPEVRAFFDGMVVLGGAISSGRAIFAAQVLGADLAYIGTGFIATDESGASQDYQQMLIESSVEDIVLSDKITGINANWLGQSLAKSAQNSSKPLNKIKMWLTRSLLGKLLQKKLNFAKIDTKWRDIYSAGQGVGNTSTVLPAKILIQQLKKEYDLIKKESNYE